MGNYHVVKYGRNHFLRLLGLSAAAGTLSTGLATKNDREFSSAGGIALSAGLITYHAFRNPLWFKFGISSYPLMALIILYSAFNNDRAALGGVGAGYLAFLAAL